MEKGTQMPRTRRQILADAIGASPETLQKRMINNDFECDEYIAPNGTYYDVLKEEEIEGRVREMIDEAHGEYLQEMFGVSQAADIPWKTIDPAVYLTDKIGVFEGYHIYQHT